MSTCPFDGAHLSPDGSCPRGEGWPITQRQCPDACPICRRPLTWHGDCHSCRPDGLKPGHLYDYAPYDQHDPRSGHWRIVQQGPQRILTVDQDAAP
jgi:hypothetical protein